MQEVIISKKGPVELFKFGSYILGKPLMYVYVFYIDGLLFDTGHANMEKRIISTIGHLPVNQVFVSHHHEDHSANAAALKSHFNAPIYTSKKCRDIMLDPPPVTLGEWMTWGPARAFDGFEVVENVIRTHKYEFELIPIPGHAVDMYALYERSEGWLFSSDLYVSSKIKYFIINESMYQQIQSLRRVMELEFEYLFCSHNPQFKNPKALIKAKLDFFIDYYNQVKFYRDKGHNLKGILKAMNLKESWVMRFSTHGRISTKNMVKVVLRDLDEYGEV